MKNKILIILLFTFCSQIAFANQKLGQFATGSNPESTDYILYILIITLIIELLVIFILSKGILKLLSILKNINSLTLSKEKKKNNKFFSFENINETVSLEQEDTLLLHHDFDGIKELDNKIPSWFMWFFYATIAFAVVYIMLFHVFKTEPLPIEEYNLEVIKAEKQLEEYRKTANNLIDETNVVLVTEKDKIANGEKIFKQNCTPCHGAFAQGIVGPNLTDDYWLHGGDVKDLFKTIKYGVPEKGMKSWRNDLSSSQIQDVIGYIKTLKGTNPANAKEKQGELYIENNTTKE